MVWNFVLSSVNLQLFLGPKLDLARPRGGLNKTRVSFPREMMTSIFNRDYVKYGLNC